MFTNVGLPRRGLESTDGGREAFTTIGIPAELVE
jgi:hypothetical protein